MIALQIHALLVAQFLPRAGSFAGPSICGENAQLVRVERGRCRFLPAN
jgi:hypothetical protein